MKMFKRYLYANGKLVDEFEVAGVDYSCGACGAFGVKLWRPYQDSRVDLRCTHCACAEQGKTYTPGESEIGWYVPAIPDELPDDNRVCSPCFWGYTSIPAKELVWWRALPEEPINVDGKS